MTTFMTVYDSICFYMLEFLFSHFTQSHVVSGRAITVSLNLVHFTHARTYAGKQFTLHFLKVQLLQINNGWAHAGHFAQSLTKHIITIHPWCGSTEREKDQNNTRSGKNMQTHNGEYVRIHHQNQHPHASYQNLPNCKHRSLQEHI